MVVGKLLLKIQITFEQLDSLLIIENRPVVVLFHAGGGKFCHQMKQTTLLDKEVVESIETNFYLISFDVETRENIGFSGVDFHLSQVETTLEFTN